MFKLVAALAWYLQKKDPDRAPENKVVPENGPEHNQSSVNAAKSMSMTNVIFMSKCQFWFQQNIHSQNKRILNNVAVNVDNLLDTAILYTKNELVLRHRFFWFLCGLLTGSV